MIYGKTELVALPQDDMSHCREGIMRLADIDANAHLSFFIEKEKYTN